MFAVCFIEEECVFDVDSINKATFFAKYALRFYRIFVAPLAKLFRYEIQLFLAGHDAQVSACMLARVMHVIAY